MIVKQEIKQFEIFEGKAKKITLVSYPCRFFAFSDCNFPDAQKLTISAKGQISFSSVKFSSSPMKTSRGEWRRMTLEKSTVSDLLDKISEPFRSYDINAYLTDTGVWELIITNSDDKKFKYSGPLNENAFREGAEISGFIREILIMDDLLCFDGGSNK